MVLALVITCFIFQYAVQRSECQLQTAPTVHQPLCQNSFNKAEIVNGVPKNCAIQTCSPGYDCEYNRYYEYDFSLQPQNPAVVQFVCCGGSSLVLGSGSSPGFTGSNVALTGSRFTGQYTTRVTQRYTAFTRPPQTGLGQVMMTYFDPTVPMKCSFTPNCSLFPNYLNCVDSARYGTKVCCSSNSCP